MSRGVSGFLIAVGVWTWAIWPNFLKNIWKDDRAWNDGATAFFLIHLVLVVVSLLIGTAVAWIGWRGWRASSREMRGVRSQRDFVRTRD